MARVYTVEELERAQKEAARREKIHDIINNAKYWIEEHKGEILVLAPVALSTTIAIVKVVSRQKALSKQKDLKELYCYDRSLGHYWKLRRELTNREWIEIDSRKRNGERLSDILKDLNVLA